MQEEHIFSAMFFIFEKMSGFDIYSDILDHFMITYVVTLTVRIMAGLVAISFAYQMYKKVVEGQGSYLKIIIYIVLVSLMIGVYPDFYIGASIFVNEISSSMLNASQAKNTLDMLAGKGVADGENEEKTWFQKAKENFGVDKFFEALSLPNRFAQAAMGLSSIATFCVFLIRNISILYLLAIAPFFFSCLLLESTAPYFFGWLKSFINVLLWPVWLAVILLIQSLTVSKMSMNDNVIIAYGMAAANFVYVFYIIKVMRTLPSMQSGTAGSFNTFEGLATVASMALMKKAPGALFGGIKGAFGGGGSGASSSGSTGVAGMVAGGADSVGGMATNRSNRHAAPYSKLGINMGDQPGEKKTPTPANNHAQVPVNSASSDTKNTSSTKMVPCPNCGGEGTIEELKNTKDGGICYVCGGQGFVPESWA